jgi:hypothetical protein
MHGDREFQATMRQWPEPAAVYAILNGLNGSQPRPET